MFNIFGLSKYIFGLSKSDKLRIQKEISKVDDALIQSYKSSSKLYYDENIRLEKNLQTAYGTIKFLNSQIENLTKQLAEAKRRDAKGRFISSEEYKAKISEDFLTR